MDITTANFDDGSVSVLFGQPDHSFEPAAGSPFKVGGDVPTSIAVGDVDGDHLLDLVTANAGSDTLSVLLGQPDHSFRSAPGSPFQAGPHSPPVQPFAVAIADIDADGLADLVSANGDGTVTVLLGTAVHRFTQSPGSPFRLHRSLLTSITVADFNGDGRLDIAAGGFDGVVVMYQLLR